MQGLQAAVYNRRAAQKGPVIGDVGMTKVDIAKKLSSVPLYTVTNSQHELVVVSSEVRLPFSCTCLLHYHLSRILSNCLWTCAEA